MRTDWGREPWSVGGAPGVKRDMDKGPKVEVCPVSLRSLEESGEDGGKGEAAGEGGREGRPAEAQGSM